MAVAYCAAMVVFFGTMDCRAEDPVPKPFPNKRYESVRDHSPFAVATAEAPAPPPQASFAANLFVSGLARQGDDNFVSIKSRDAGTEFSLFGNETDPTTGISVASVNWTDAIGKSTVILKKGTETAKLEFNEEAIHAAPTGGAQPKPNSPVPGGPGQRPMQTPMNMGGVPNRPMTPPVNPAISNGRPVVPGQNGGPGVHRRVQVIQPPQ